MILKKFRVKNFKSIEDSGVINCEKITSFIGINEAGKSNILLALWKLKPARGGEIVFTSDMPVSRLSDFRTSPEKHWFIEAWFEINDMIFLNQISKIQNIEPEFMSEFTIKRNYEGEYKVDFFNYLNDFEKHKNSARDFLSNNLEEIIKHDEVGKGEKKIRFKENLLIIIRETIDKLKSGNNAIDIIDALESIVELEESPMTTSKINPILKSIKNEIEKILDKLNQGHPNENLDIITKIIDRIPNFLYYANYGNLDSQIYLPRVIEDFESKRVLSEKELAKQRTLKVLFEYVNLNPKEILEMGENYRIKEPYNNNFKPRTEEEIESGLKKTKEREILLNSASSKLTRGFKDWWKQGEYSFDLSADGDYFRIWVSDEKRPDKISLEDRSTGLQWFLSFYMVFLVESKDSHQNCILLLDEAGTTLHPLAQKDLLRFFESLAENNQLLTTTHSPFLVDVDNLERTKVVYSNSEGFTEVSDDLRASEKGSTATGAVYAVHSALGLSISEGMLNGCQMVIVEGASDQYYLNAIKQYLIYNKKISPAKDIIFMPAGGIRTVKQLSSVVAGKQEVLPYIILDADKSGKDFKNKLAKDLYSGSIEKIISLDELISKENVEIEDLFPPEILNRPIEYLINDRDFRFEESYDAAKLLIPQIEEWSREFNIQLQNGYKVELAKDVKKELEKFQKRNQINEEYLEVWKKLFNRILK